MCVRRGAWLRTAPLRTLMMFDLLTFGGAKNLVVHPSSCILITIYLEEFSDQVFLVCCFFSLLRSIDMLNSCMFSVCLV